VKNEKSPAESRRPVAGADASEENRPILDIVRAAYNKVARDKPTRDAMKACLGISHSSNRRTKQ
jgi:hypothetical protein